MKFLSNFDTKLKTREYASVQKKHGKDRVELLSKSNLFRVIYVDLPFFARAFVSLLLMYGFNSWRGGAWILWWALPLLIIFWAFVLPKVIKHLIDYNMDFLIVTPSVLYRYNQEGLLRRDIMTIHSASVKSISVEKWWLLYSIFDNGNLIFFTEGDDERGEIMLNYIKDPETVRSTITDLIGRVIDNK